MSSFTVLYIVHDTELAGTSLSTLNMIRSLRQEVQPIVLLPAEGAVSRLYRSQGVECIIEKFPINWSFLKCGRNVLRYLYYDYLQTRQFINDEKRSFDRIFPLLKDRNIQIVHSASSVITIGVRLSKALHAKHVWHVREFMDLDFHIKPQLGFAYTGYLIRKSDYAIAITRAVYEHWHLQRIHDRSCYLWNAIRPESEISYDGNKENYFLFCSGNLTVEKGVDAAVRSFGKSGVSAKGFSLRLVGRCSESQQKDLLKLAAEYHCEDAISFLGFCNDVKPLMSKARGFLMTSLNEGLGRTTIEAMFYGCPVIARHSGGTVDFLRDGDNGYFFETEDECARLISQLADQIPTGLIHRSQSFVRSYFTEEVYGREIMKIYRRVLCGNKG